MAIHLVTNTNDSGAGSLRQAIIDANADGTTPRNINFSIGSGVQTIQPLTVLPALTVPQIIIDGSTQPGWSSGNPVIVLDGTTSAFSFDCFAINATTDCVIQDLVINNGFDAAISIENSSNNNAVYGCFIGTNQSGTAASPNGIGIVITTGNNNIIGSVGRGNVLSGNAGGLGAGILMIGNVNNSIIQSNFVGTDKTGMSSISNSAVGIGIIFPGGSLVTVADGNLIGGSNVGEGNIISGNSTGSPVIPAIFMGFQSITNTVIKGNKIGVDATGNTALPNIIGIVTFTNIATTVDGTIIGGSGANERNIISGNTNGGIILQISVDNSIIKNNFVGTDSTGMVAIPNGSQGMVIQGSGNIIGGSASNESNIISGNVGDGLLVIANSQSLSNSNNNIIKGNLIGTDITGASVLGNSSNGIALFGDAGFFANGTIIGGSASGEGNIISGNTQNGIGIFQNANNSVVKGNFIGTDETGLINLGNGQDGIGIAGSLNMPCSNNFMGGITSPEKNIIRFNGNNGVNIGGDPATPSILNSILGNLIYSNTQDGINLFNMGNNDQDVPVINHACISNDTLMINVTAPTLPTSTNFRIEFFLNDTDTNPKTEGKSFIGSADPVASGQTVEPVFVVSPAVLGKWISATATNLNNVGNTYGDTSEFTLNTIVRAAPLLTLTASPAAVSPGQSSTLTLTIVGASPYDLVWSDGLVQTGQTSPVIRSVTPSVSTTYSVEVADANDCTASASVTVSVLSVINDNPIFEPAMKIIVNITNAEFATVTTASPHRYIVGTIVRIVIPPTIVPPGFGMQQIHNLVGTIIEITSPTTFIIDIDTRYMDVFTIPPAFPGHYYTPAEVVPVGEINSTLLAALRNILP